MKIIRGVLSEELENSLQMKKQYKQALDAFPKGSLVEKNIKGRKYYYLAFREDKKVKFVYKGKMSEDELKRFREAQKMRAKYRKFYRQVNNQIIFLDKILRGKTI